MDIYRWLKWHLLYYLFFITVKLLNTQEKHSHPERFTQFSMVKYELDFPNPLSGSVSFSADSFEIFYML